MFQSTVFTSYRNVFFFNFCYVLYYIKHIFQANKFDIFFVSMSLSQIPSTIEVGFIKRTNYAGQYPGLFLFTDVARMIRPVTNLRTKKTEYIGTFEQVRQI